MGYYCDYDPPEFVSTDLRAARKQHICCECSRVILPGEKYEHLSGKWGGRIKNFDTCVKCADLRDSISGCFAYGYLKDAYFDYLDQSPSVRIPEGTDAYDMCDKVFEKHRVG